MNQLEAAVTGSWNTTTSGRWGTATNWTSNPNVPGVPGTTTDAATFPTLGTATVTITLENSGGGSSVSPELQTLSMAGGILFPTQYTIQQFGGAGTLVMTNAPTITLQDTNNVINAPITTDSDLTIALLTQGTATFGAASSLHATMAGTTLNIIGPSQVFPSLTINSAAGSGFADNMTIVLNTPSSVDPVGVTNTVRFGSAAPSITLNPFALLANEGSGHVGSPTIPFSMGNGSIFDNNSPGTLLEAQSFAVNAMSGVSMDTNIVNNGKIHITNNFTITTTPIFAIESSNLETNPVTMAGQGTEFIVGGMFINDGSWTPNIDTRNNASVMGAFTGNLFQIAGTETLHFGNGVEFQNGNFLMSGFSDTINGGIGSFFNAPNLSLITDTGTQTVLNNFNTMSVSGGGTGARMAVASLDLTSGLTQVITDTSGMGTTISGTNSIGSLLQVSGDITVRDNSLFLATNMQSVSGTGSAGCKLALTGSLTTTPTTTGNGAACINLGGLTGMGTKGAWLEITTGDLLLQNDAPSSPPLTNGLYCLNDFGTINGDASTYGAYVHVANGNVTLTNSAQLNINNAVTSNVVNGGGIGARVFIENAGATFQMSDSANILIQNDGLTNMGYGVGAQLDAAPLLNMSSGTLSLLNTGTLNTSSTFAAIGNLNSGIAWTGGTISINNQNTMTPSQSITSGNGAQLNITGNLSMASTCTLNLTNTFGLTSSIASQLHLTGGMTLVSGSAVILSNTGNATSGTGSSLIVPGNLLSAGDMVLTNTGTTLSTASRGNELAVAGTFIQTAGFIVNQSTGSTPDGTSFGSLIRASAHPIQVQGGTFINDDRVQTTSVPVSHRALLAGNGTFEGLTIGSDTAVTSSGTVYPGDPTNTFTSPSGPTIGTMIINGTYTQNSDGNFFVNILNVGTFSKLEVLGAGTADLQGTVTVGMVPGAHIAVSDTYNIIETLTSVTNQSLNPIVVLDPSYTSTLIPQIRYIAGPVTLFGAPNFNIVQLFFLQGPSTAPLLTSYSLSFEPLFDLINRDNLILEREMQRMRLRYQHEYVVSARKSSSRRLAKTSAPRTDIAFDQIPSITTISNKIPSDDNNLAFARHQNEIEQQRMDEEMVCTYQDRPWNFFIGPVGDVGTIKTKQNQIGSDYWAAGGLTSFNYVFSQGGIGLFADYNKLKADVHRHWGNFNFDMAHSCLYGTYSPKQAPDLAFHSIVGGSYEWYTINRKTTTKTAKGKTRGGEFDALFTGEYVFAGSPCSDFPEHLTIIPRAGVQYIYADVSRYKEHGATTSDLTIHALHAKSLRSILDLWMKYQWEWTNVKLTPELNIGWQREFFDKNHKVYFTPISVALPTSSVRAFGAGRNTFLAGLDLFLEFYEKYALEASYDFQWNSLIRDNGFYLGFHTRF
jgi:uncharacterized protein YhjY with autotransporter beta-barrel domain